MAIIMAGIPQRSGKDMYVCICQAVTDKQIRAAVREGCRTVDDLTDALGVAAACGRCRPQAAEIVAEELGTMSAEPRARVHVYHSHP
ncbi:MAG: bacterioferritin-associated ferredoxin [Gammaproteobacteria bacterium]